MSKSLSEKSPTMTNAKDKPAAAAIKDQSPDGLREIVCAVRQEMLKAEMTDALRAQRRQHHKHLKSTKMLARLNERSGDARELARSEMIESVVGRTEKLPP